MRKLFWISVIVALPFFGITAIQVLKIPIPDEKDCLVVKGIVADIYEAGEKDVVFELKGQSKTFYINRGLELGLDLQTLRTDLLNKQITIKYPEHFTGAGHISKLETAGRIVYSELNSK